MPWALCATDMASVQTHVRLTGLFLQGASGRAVLDTTRVPVADKPPRRPTGPIATPVQCTRHGRRVGRIRYPHRSSRLVKPDCHLVSLNTQGLNWRLLSHCLKLRDLLQTAKERSWNIVMLTDLHMCPEDWQGQDVKPQVIYLEEYVLIQWFRVGFLLDTPARQQWESLGRPHITSGERALSISLKFGQHTYHFCPVYAPVQSERALRTQFFQDLTVLCRKLPAMKTILGGDWNGHLGQDVNRIALRTPTARGGKDILQFLDAHPGLQMIDQFFHIPNRGTWRHSVSKRWYELDFFIASPDILKMVQKARVQPFSFSDHSAKVLCLHPVSSSQPPWKGAKFAAAQKHGTAREGDLEAIKGPSTSAKQLREQIRTTMNAKLEPFLQEYQLSPSPNTPTLHIFVDGSYFAQDKSAGWGVWIPTHELEFFGPVVLDIDSAMHIGAEHSSTNTGELSAMVFALMWILTSNVQANICIVYNSQYAADITQQHWTPRANSQLAAQASHYLRCCQHRVHVSFQHVHSHTQVQDFWSQNNAHVDTLAKQGARGHSQVFPEASHLIANRPEAPSVPSHSWSELADKCHEVLKECVPHHTRHPRTVPYSQEALQELDRRRLHLKDLQRLFHEARGTADEHSRYEAVKVYKRSLLQWSRRQRSYWIMNLCKQLDTAMRLNDMGRFYKLLRSLGINMAGKSYEGHTPFGLEDITSFVEKVGNETFNMPQDLDSLLPEPSPVAWEFNGPPEETEVLMALSKMKDSKGGTDGITVGIIRAMGPWFQRLLAKTVRTLWTTAPQQWEAVTHEVMGVLLHKKGSRNDLNNYRCIQLINVISRLLAKVVDGRVQRFAESHNILPNNQYGFRKYRSTVGPIMLVRIIAEICRSYPIEEIPTLLLIDIRKAYPRIPRELAWHLFDRLGLPPNLMQVIKGLHDNAIYRVRTNAGLGRQYRNQIRGFREGCPSSPALFNMFHTFPIKHFTEERRATRGSPALVGGCQTNKPFTKVKAPRREPAAENAFQLDNVLFADDTTVFTTAQHCFEDEHQLQTVLSQWGEDLHPQKTERLPLGKSAASVSDSLGASRDKFQDHARFLGAWLTSDASQRKDTDERLRRAQKLWNKLWRQMRRLTLPAKTKGQLFQATVMATLLYSAESRGFTQNEIRRMQTFVNRCVLGMLNVRLRDMHDRQLTIVNLWRQLGIPSVNTAIGVKQLSWLGHLARMPETRLERQALWLWLYNHGSHKSGKRSGCRGTIDTTRALWSRLMQLAKTLDQPTDNWPTQWVERAQHQHGVQWRADIKTWKKQQEAKEDKDLWQQRHAPGGPAETQAANKARRRAEAEQLNRNEDGLYLCPHCNAPFALNRIWQHAHSCAVLSPPRRVLAAEARQRRRQRLAHAHAPLAQQLQPAANAVPAAQVHPPPLPVPPAHPIAPPARRLRQKQPDPNAHINLPRVQHPPQNNAGARAEAPAVASPDNPSRIAPPKPRAARRIGVSDLPKWWTRDTDLRPSQCQWCRKDVQGTLANHEKLCRSMPYDVWLRGIRLLRPGLITDFKCGQCGASFLESRGRARHEHECRRRREAAKLPLDTNTFHVLPEAEIPATNPKRFKANSQQVAELDAASCRALQRYQLRKEADPNYEVPPIVIANSCVDPETNQPCPKCRKCSQCRAHACWGACGICKHCRRCSRALLFMED